MLSQSSSIRTFIGALDYQASRSFYQELGFEEFVVSEKMIYYQVNAQLGFYLQDYYVKDWINNSMIFLEVNNVEDCFEIIQQKKLPEKYKYVKLSEIQYLDWGCEFFMHDPSGVLWHIGQFN